MTTPNHTGEMRCDCGPHHGSDCTPAYSCCGATDYRQPCTKAPPAPKCGDCIDWRPQPERCVLYGVPHHVSAPACPRFTQRKP